ncbi:MULTISPECIES: AlpA family phage regulatory protein [unclassified Desulfovibrio]|uniref:helix-turn-helix transcriptional regulator n=1 Tax=unclassified Desulfovibrio TaxID=2593640 RepID=UPI0013ED6C4E|nr:MULTISPECIES: AlpA family phage regulatory protein [unclassified Desulfovibrio]
MPKAKSTAATPTASTVPAPSTSPLTENRFLRRREVEARTGLCCSAIYAGMKRGTFPAPVQIGSRAVAWRSRDIEAFLEFGIDWQKGLSHDGE